MKQPSNEWVKFAAVPELGLQGLHAHFQRHEYERHAHDYFVLGTIDAGAPKVALERYSFVAPPGSAMLINPGESHDGKPCDEQGYVYSMVYIEPRVIAGIAQELEMGSPGSILFTRPVIAETDIVQALRRLHRLLFAEPDRLARETALIEALTPLLRRFSTRAVPAWTLCHEPRIERVRELMHAGYADPLTTEYLAQAAGLSRVRLNQLFRQAYGLPLHAYLNAVRLEAAKRLLRAGLGAAEVAAAVGLADQSHLIRRFKGSFGITPRHFLAAHFTDVQSRR